MPRRHSEIDRASKILKIHSFVATRSIVWDDFSMGRKLTEDEFNDPDFQALLAALTKASKPLGYLRSAIAEPVRIRTAKKLAAGSCADAEH